MLHKNKACIIVMFNDRIIFYSEYGFIVYERVFYQPFSLTLFIKVSFLFYMYYLMV